jgi:hypothetical protein
LVGQSLKENRVMMSANDIHNAVDGIMALRPERAVTKREPRKSSTTASRMTDVQFQLEIAAIMKDEQIEGSAYFFSNTEPQKCGNKNLSFNPYRGEVK